MTTITNSFEGGTSGTTISTANSGGASGTAFDVVNVGSGGTLVYDGTYAAHGSLSAKAITTTAAATDMNWKSTGVLPAGPTWYMRMYLYFTGNPGAAFRLANITNSVSGSNGYVQLNSGGKLQLIYGSSGTVFVTFTASVPLSTWFRVEWSLTGSATTGQIAGFLFAGDSTAATESHISAADLNTGAVSSGTSTLAWGTSTSVANLGPFWMDDLGVSSTGYLGPVVKATEGSAGNLIVPVLEAAGII